MHRDTLRKLLNIVVPYVLPLPALTAFALTDLAWLGWLAWAASLGYLAWRYRLDGLGEQRLVRSLLVVAPLVGTRSAAPWVAGILIVGLTGVEPLLTAAAETGRLRTRNLDVRRSLPQRMHDPRWPYLAQPVLLVGFAVTVGGGFATWPLLAGILAVTAITGLFLGYAWLHRRTAHGHQHDPAVWQALVRHAPRFAIHFSAPTGTEYHVGMWLPYLERLGLPYLVIVREAECLAPMARLTGAPVVLAPTMGHLEQVVPPGVTTCFYVNNANPNVHMVRLAQLTHVQLLHGDSDKASSYHPATAMYDRIFVAGQAGIDRYADHGVLIPEQKFAIVGRPQVSQVRIDRRPISTVAQPTVLYAPTWAGWFDGMNHCSLSIGPAIVRGLLARGATVICRPHPYTTRNQAAARQLAAVEQLLASDAARTGRDHRWGDVTSRQMSLVDCMNAADAMVSDVTAVASDWLYSEKPFAIVDMTGQGERFAATFPLARAAYVVDRTAGNLDRALDQLLDADPLATTRREMKTYYLGDFPDKSYVDAFVAEARRCVLGVREPAVAVPLA